MAGQPAPPPATIPLRGYAAERLMAIKAQMEKARKRPVTWAEVLEQLLDVYSQVVPG